MGVDHIPIEYGSRLSRNHVLLSRVIGILGYVPTLVQVQVPHTASLNRRGRRGRGNEQFQKIHINGSFTSLIYTKSRLVNISIIT